MTDAENTITTNGEPASTAKYVEVKTVRQRKEACSSESGIPMRTVSTDRLDGSLVLRFAPRSVDGIDKQTAQ